MREMERLEDNIRHSEKEQQIMAKYVEIHLMVEEKTLRDIKQMCNLKRMVGRDAMCSEAWVKVITAMQDQKNAADVCLKEYDPDRQ